MPDRDVFSGSTAATVLSHWGTDEHGIKMLQTPAKETTLKMELVSEKCRVSRPMVNARDFQLLSSSTTSRASKTTEPSRRQKKKNVLVYFYQNYYHFDNTRWQDQKRFIDVDLDLKRDHTKNLDPINVKVVDDQSRDHIDDQNQDRANVNDQYLDIKNIKLEGQVRVNQPRNIMLDLL